MIRVSSTEKTGNTSAGPIKEALTRGERTGTGIVTTGETPTAELPAGGCAEGRTSAAGSRRIRRFSYVRVFACVAIIALHTVYAANINCLDVISIAENTVSRAFENCLMWAVPSFLMVTGALLLNPEKEITLQKLFGKYIFRVAAALLLFCVIYRVFDIIAGHEVFTAAAVMQGVLDFFRGSGWQQLWYLYLLIGLYLLMPFYKKIAKYSSDTELKYLMAVYVVFVSILPVLNIWGINYGFYISTTLIYPLYLFLGHAIYEKRLKIGAAPAIAMTVLSTLALIGVTVVRWKTGFSELSFLYGYSSIFVVIQTAGIFSLFCGLRLNGRGDMTKRGMPGNTDDLNKRDNQDKPYISGRQYKSGEYDNPGEHVKPGSQDEQSSSGGQNNLNIPDKSNEPGNPDEAGGHGKFNRIIGKIDECSFGIYLIHIIFVNLIFKYIGFNPYEYGGVLCFAAIIAGNFLISFLITWALRKLPGLRKIL